MKRFYFLITALFVFSFMSAQYTIADVNLNGQAFKKLTGTVDANETLDNTSLWIIADSVRVATNAKLTITQGTQIFAETPQTVLLVENLEDLDGGGNPIGVSAFGEIDWQGTSTNPIVFNSLANAPGQGAGDDSAGQWDGIRIEGGGPGSNSGIIRYVRVMYSGLGSNGLELRNVGNGTTVEYVQVYKNDGTAGIRVNSGDVNLKYIVATNGADRGLRFDDDGDTGGGGWSGAGQFIVVNKDIPAGNAIEARDNTLPILSNVTITGVGFNSPGSTPDGNGFRVRDDGDLKIYNTVVTGVDRSVRIDNNSGIANGDSVFANSASFDNNPGQDSGTGFHSSADVFNPTSASYDPSFNNSVTPFSIVDSYVGTSTANSTPAGALDPFFDDVNYVGAVQAGDGNDWTFGWTVTLDGTVLSVSDNSLMPEIVVYPNPVQDNLKLNTNSNISAVALYNTLGKKVYENLSFDNNNKQIDMSQFERGVYLLKVMSDNVPQTFKIIKK